jgi:NAD(P)-dependent dehydrogenase (short-subunit alcohol dehydrogenase family)
MKDQRVVVVGGSSGMGLAIARAADGAGARVVVASRSLAKCREAAATLSSSAECRALDMTEEESVRGFFEDLGPIDHLVMPGSAVSTGSARTTPTDDLMASIRSKFLGPFLCARHARLSPGGSILFFSGILSRKPGTSSLLGAINAAVETLARGLALEFAPVRVNVISPGLTRGTGAFDAMPEAAREGMFSSVASRLPLGKVVDPEDIARAALYLMTASSVTGTVLDVDGGGLLAG